MSDLTFFLCAGSLAGIAVQKKMQPFWFLEKIATIKWSHFLSRYVAMMTQFLEIYFKYKIQNFVRLCSAFY